MSKKKIQFDNDNAAEASKLAIHEALAKLGDTNDKYINLQQVRTHERNDSGEIVAHGLRIFDQDGQDLMALSVNLSDNTLTVQTFGAQGQQAILNKIVKEHTPQRSAGQMVGA
jgi:hypothetical protein